MLKRIKVLSEKIKDKLSCSSCSCSYSCTAWKKVIAAAVIGIIVGVVLIL
tara:strand:+ start:3722 stop:3871 length:150 start_codon:yes stop_codon:yes gene_type:complete